MLDNTPGTVVVAAADKHARAALSYAAEEVRRGGSRVRVVHVVPAFEASGGPAPVVVEGDTLRRAGADVVDELTAVLEREFPETVVIPTVLHGRTTSELVRSAHGARCVVVQRRPRGWRRAVTLSTVSGVAAHASAPVVVVPSEWEPDAARERVVTVGVDDAVTAPHLIATALDQARQRDARLRIVHAWHFNDTYEDIVFDGEAARTHEKELSHDIERALAATLAQHTETPAEVVVHHSRPADLLIEESRSAGLLVLGRHRPLVSFGPHLGSVVRAVLRESHCPVLVVDPAAAPG